MDNNYYTLPRLQNVLNGDKETTFVVDLKGNYTLIQGSNYSEVISLNKLYEDERENSNIYFVNGSLEILSPIHNIPNTYDDITYFYDITKKNEIDFLNRYEMYLCYFDAFVNENYEVVNVSDIEEGVNYIKRYKILTNSDELLVKQFSFAKNYYGDSNLYYYFNKRIDVSELRDGYNAPLTSLFIYFKIKTNNSEVLYEKSYDEYIDKILSKTNFAINDYVYGDKINIDITNVTEIILEKQQHTFFTKPIKIYRNVLKTAFDVNTLSFIYEPFFELPIRLFSDYIEVATEGYNETQPDYALFKDGQYFWRDIGLKSEIDRPFTDGNHYIFEELFFATPVNIEHSNTANFYQKFKYNQRIKNNRLLTDDINLC